MNRVAPAAVPHDRPPEEEDTDPAWRVSFGAIEGYATGRLGSPRLPVMGIPSVRVETGGSSTLYREVAT